MLHKYLQGLFRIRRSYDHVIQIKHEQLIAIKCLPIEFTDLKNVKVRSMNFGFDFAPATKYDFTNIRCSSKTQNLNKKLILSIFLFIFQFKFLKFITKSIC